MATRKTNQLKESLTPPAPSSVAPVAGQAKNPLTEKRESGTHLRASLRDAIAFALRDGAWANAANLRAAMGAPLPHFSRVTSEMHAAGELEARGWGGGREYRLAK